MLFLLLVTNNNCDKTQVLTKIKCFAVWHYSTNSGLVPETCFIVNIKREIILNDKNAQLVHQLSQLKGSVCM